MRVTGPAPRPVVALRSGVGRRSTRPIDDPQLTVIPLIVRAGQLGDDRIGALTRPQELEATGPVAEVRQGLGCDRSDRGGAPRNGGAHGEKLGGDRHAPGFLVQVAGDD